jgi:hypothetical protein
VPLTGPAIYSSCETRPNADHSVPLDDDQQPSRLAIKRLLCHDTACGSGLSLGTRHPAARQDPGVLTGARHDELPAEAGVRLLPADQRQSGFSPETPVISREIRGIGGTHSRGRSSAFAGTFSVCTQSNELLAMQKVEGSNPFSRFTEGPAK